MKNTVIAATLIIVLFSGCQETNEIAKDTLGIAFRYLAFILPVAASFFYWKFAPNKNYFAAIGILAGVHLVYILFLCMLSNSSYTTIANFIYKF